MNVKKLFQIIIICLFKSFVQLRVHEVSVHFCDLFQHCFICVLCSLWQCHSHICVTEGSAHFVLSVFLCSTLFVPHSSPLSFTVFLLYVFVCSGVWLESKDLTENNSRENSTKLILGILILCDIMKKKARCWWNKGRILGVAMSATNILS